MNDRSYIFRVGKLSGGIGYASESLGNRSAALIYFKEVIAQPIPSDNTGLLDNKGIALEELGNHTAAISSFDRSIAINPNDAEPYYNKGYALDRIYNFTGALAAYDKALKLTPKNPDILSNRNLTLYAIHLGLEPTWKLYD